MSSGSTKATKATEATGATAPLRAAAWARSARAWIALLVGTSACSGPAAPTPAAPGAAAADCARFPEAGSSAYVLPFAVGQRFPVTRTVGHYTPLNQGVGLYAIDFLMPIGTAVHALRSGTVVAVEERYTDDDRGEYHENWVMIRHADDTVARYIHLTGNGAAVEVGDAVEQGQLVGWSGNSGPSSAPHLHVDVQTCGPNLPPAYNPLPCGMTVPLSFRNTEAHSCGLAAGQSYTALPYSRDGR